MDYHKHPDRGIQHLLSMPFIYGMIIPAVFLDICLETYHRICFRLYGLPYVDRTKYIVLDRHRLHYLSTLEKINCSYCGYVNGLFAYAVRIAGDTEKYWCSIKHEKNAHPHQEKFLAFGDEKAYIRHDRPRMKK